MEKENGGRESLPTSLAAEEDQAKGRTVRITLSDGALKDFETVAKSKGIPLATWLRTVLESHHESPGFGALLRRCWKTGDFKEPSSAVNIAREIFNLAEPLLKKVR